MPHASCCGAHASCLMLWCALRKDLPRGFHYLSSDQAPQLTPTRNSISNRLSCSLPPSRTFIHIVSSTRTHCGCLSTHQHVPSPLPPPSTQGQALLSTATHMDQTLGTFALQQITRTTCSVATFASVLHITSEFEAASSALSRTPVLQHCLLHAHIFLSWWDVTASTSV